MKSYLYLVNTDFFGETHVDLDSLHSFRSKTGAYEYATKKIQEYLKIKLPNGKPRYEIYDPRNFRSGKYSEQCRSVVLRDNDVIHNSALLVRVIEIEAEDDATDKDDNGTRYTYFWYHGGMSADDIDHAEECLQTHDFESFQNLRKKYSGKNNFPETICVFKDSTLIEHLPVNDIRNFSFIQVEDHENG